MREFITARLPQLPISVSTRAHAHQPKMHVHSETMLRCSVLPCRHQEQAHTSLLQHNLSPQMSCSKLMHTWLGTYALAVLAALLRDCPACWLYPPTCKESTKTDLSMRQHKLSDAVEMDQRFRTTSAHKANVHNFKIAMHCEPCSFLQSQPKYAQHRESQVSLD